MESVHSSDETQGRIHRRTYCKGCTGDELEERPCDSMPGKEMGQLGEIKQINSGVEGLITWPGLHNSVVEH